MIKMSKKGSEFFSSFMSRFKVLVLKKSKPRLIKDDEKVLF
jgi:hypothetical protein